MSQHPSLRSKGKGLRFRSVLKRFEKLLHLKKKEQWSEESSIFGIPKIKQLRYKIKKEKAAPEEAAAAAGAEGTPEAASAEGKEGKGAKEAKPAKEAKGGEKGKESKKERQK